MIFVNPHIIDMEFNEYEKENEENNDELYESITKYQKIEEHVVNIHMKLKDFLYESGERDLLSLWSVEDTAIFVYDSTYLKQIGETETDLLF